MKQKKKKEKAMCRENDGLDDSSEQGGEDYNWLQAYRAEEREKT